MPGSMLADIPGVVRIETHPKEEVIPQIVAATHAVYPHDEVYGRFCTIQDYVAAPPRELYSYLADVRSLEEWTYTTRDLEPMGEPGLWLGADRLAAGTRIYLRAVTNPDAMTVDYHCAWDQGADLWMIYLMRVIDAQLVLGKPGSVLTWTNCRHPNYDRNPYPETAPAGRPEWVGDFWDLFYAGHLLELRNLKAIAESRHANGLPITPAAWAQVSA